MERKSAAILCALRSKKKVDRDVYIYERDSREVFGARSNCYFTVVGNLSGLMYCMRRFEYVITKFSSFRMWITVYIVLSRVARLFTANLKAHVIICL